MSVLKYPIHRLWSAFTPHATLMRLQKLLSNICNFNLLGYSKHKPHKKNIFNRYGIYFAIGRCIKGGSHKPAVLSNIATHEG
jgi:hypothetical protein